MPSVDATAWEKLNLAEIGEALAVKRRDIHDIFEKYPDLNMSEDTTKEIRERNEDLNVGVKRYETLREMSLIAEDTRAKVAAAGSPVPIGSNSDTREKIVATAQFSMRKSLEASEDYMRNKGAAKPRFIIEIKDYDPGAHFKTLMTTTANGFPPESVRSGLMVPYAMRRPMVADMIPQDTIDQPAVVYMEETVFDNQAAPVAEGAQKPESGLEYVQRTVPVEVIATWIPITRQQLDDVPQLEALLNNRMRLMLSLAEESQLLSGNGSTPQLQGFYGKTGVQTQATGADPVPDAIYKAMTKVRFGSGVAGTGFAEPSAVILHPNDWQDIRLLRTVNGEYIWGSPADAGVERVWGMPVVITPAATENTGLLGDFQLYSHISRKMGVTLDVSDQHSDFFIKNKLAIRIEERLSLEIYRPSAFCLVTSI